MSVSVHLSVSLYESASELWIGRCTLLNINEGCQSVEKLKSAGIGFSASTLSGARDSLLALDKESLPQAVEGS